MQPDRPAHQFRRQDVALKELPQSENSRHDADPQPIGCIGNRIAIGHFDTAPELKQGKPHRQRTANQRSDVGNESDKTGDKTHDQAKVQPRNHQRHGIISAQHQTDRPLPANERGQGGINVARQFADCPGVVAWQHFVDFRCHLVPVKQHVNGHDRHDDDQDEDVDKPKRRGHQPVHEISAFGLDRFANGQKLLIGNALVIQKLRKTRGQPVAEPVEKLRGGVDQRGRLLDQRRDYEQDQQDKDQNGDERDDRDSHDPAEPGPFEPVCDGIKQIGNRPAQHKGQDNIAQKPQGDQKDGRGNAPVFCLLSDRKCHGSSVVACHIDATCSHATQVSLCSEPAMST